MREWCEGCEDRDKLITRLKQQIKELEQENQQLKNRPMIGSRNGNATF